MAAYFIHSLTQEAFVCDLMSKIEMCMQLSKCGKCRRKVCYSGPGDGSISKHGAHDAHMYEKLMTHVFSPCGSILHAQHLRGDKRTHVGIVLYGKSEPS